MATDSDDLLGIIEVDLLDGHSHAEDLRLKRQREALLEHRQESDALLGVAVGVDDGLCNQLFQASPARRPSPTPCPRPFSLRSLVRHGLVTWHGRSDEAPLRRT